MDKAEPFADYIGYGSGGFMYNMKYPPNPAANEGFTTVMRQTIRRHFFMM